MSLNRDQNIAPDTSLLPDIPFKKRKDSTLHEISSHYYDDDGDKKHKKNRSAKSTFLHFDEHVAQADSLDKGICGSFAALSGCGDDDDDDDDNDDDDDTVYKNPYLNHVRSNVTAQEGEGSHNFMSSLLAKGSNHMSLSDVNNTGQNLRAQDGLFSSYKYFNLPDELCGVTSDVDNYPYDFSLTRNKSSSERSEAGDTSKIMWPACGERSDGFVSSLMLKPSSRSCASILNEDSAALADLSSASSKLHKLNDDLMRKKVDHENSGISGDRTSSMQINPDPIPSSSSESCADLRTLKYDLRSENVFSSLSPVGTRGNGQFPASVSYNSTSVTPFRTQLASSLKLCENELTPSSESGIKPKPASNQTSDLSSSLTLNEHYCHPGSEFSTHSKLSRNQPDALPLSLKTRSSQPVLTSACVAHASSSSSVKLPESDYSSYKCGVDFNVGELKSGSPTTVKFIECAISPVFGWKSRTENETVHFSVSEHSSSSESFRNVDRSGIADSSLKTEVKCTESDSVDVLTKNKLWKFKNELPHIIQKTPCFEIGTAREVDTISKQGPSSSYEGSQSNLDKKVGEDIPVVGQQCQGRETTIKEEHYAVGNTELPCGANSCIPEVSGILPVKSKGVLNAAALRCDAIQDVNADGRKCEEDGAVCVDVTQSVNGDGEQNRGGNSDHEETIFVSDDSDDDTITIYDNDGFEEPDDDIEIVKCLSKSRVGKMDISVEQKALDSANSQARYKNRDHKDQNMLAHPVEVNNVFNFSQSLTKPNLSSSSNDAGNSMNKQRGDERLFWWKSLLDSHGESSDSATNASGFPAAKSLCLDVYSPPPAHTPQLRDVCELSRSTVTQPATPYSVSPVRSIVELAERQMFSQYSGSNFQYLGRPPLDLVYPSSSNLSFPLSSESTSFQGIKKHGCDTNLIPAPNECEAGVRNPPVPNSSSSNFADASAESILNIVPNSLEMSVEPGNQEERFVPPKGMSQLMPALDTPLETPGTSHNVQEGKEVAKKEQNTVEDNTVAAQRRSTPGWECAICLETISNKRGISATVCGHVYCTPCITKVMCKCKKKKECPTCRRTLDSTQVFPLFM